jgi:hypothetical protein
MVVAPLAGAMLLAWQESLGALSHVSPPYSPLSRIRQQNLSRVGFFVRPRAKGHEMGVWRATLYLDPGGHKGPHPALHHPRPYRLTSLLSSTNKPLAV